MSLALREAEKGMYTTHPNPRVGCVLVRNDEILGSGFHLQTGSAHAEANALRNTGDDAKGATAYVTLEPCSFEGRTPSCSEALIDAGVTRVVYAMTDPHPKNRGAGLKKLCDSGVEVSGPVFEESARRLNPGYVKRFEVGLPFVRLKLAMSLDGKTALSNGQSQWITGRAARKDVQRLRARSSAVVTGVQTVVDDDPALTVRAEDLDTREATLASEIERKIVVLDPNFRIPASAKLLADPNLLLATLSDPTDSGHPGVERIQLPEDGNRRIELNALLKELAQRDCNEVLFECGATLAGSLLQQQHVDELIIYVAPKLMGDKARSLVDFTELTDMNDVPELVFTDVRNLGGDIRITAKLKKLN